MGKTRGDEQVTGGARRDQILDAAEALFALHGYHGVALRAITRKAGVDLALSRYYFGSKANLFAEVIGRRAPEMSGAMLAGLETLLDGGEPLSVRAVLDAYVAPIFERLETGDPGWRNYIHLTSQLRNAPDSPFFTHTFNAAFLPMERRYVQALRSILPDSSEEDIYWNYYFFNATVASVMVDTRVLDNLSDGSYRTSNLDSLRRRLAPFFSLAFGSH